MNLQDAESSTILIKPAQGWVSLHLKELWEYRELFYFLVWRDMKVRYKQTILGVAWAILQPVFTMFVFTVFFGWLAHMPSDGVPIPSLPTPRCFPGNCFSGR